MLRNPQKWVRRADTAKLHGVTKCLVWPAQTYKRLRKLSDLPYFVDVDNKDLLRQAELFRAVSPEQLDFLVSRSREVTAKRNHVLFEEGDQASELYIVKSGRIAIFRTAPGRPDSTVTFMEESDLFGEQSLFDGEGRSAGARALDEGTIVIGVPYAAVREVLDSSPMLVWEVVRLMSLRLRATDAALADSVFLDVSGRTAKRLLELSGDQDEFTLPITQEELASLVGASRERVNKALAMFSKLGWLEQIDRRYRILNRDALEMRSR